MGGLPPALLNDIELQQLMLPTLKADFKLGETYQYDSTCKLGVPAIVLYGTRDKAATGMDMQHWESCFKQSITPKAIPGRHFFMQDSSALVLKEINAVLETLSPL
ncbi:thioesterase II family protein [Pseudoalteromonas sp. HM-SA03]|uniref:thioesterase II family protein n=1 Tax=Pseudoalteromonas sp. HM-SA03 TaxID=2029678 RepID=UPI0020D1E31D|nr:thioesterase domain-containing protein [Pseudoalteromonas sp. HM-SA03]